MELEWTPLQRQLYQEIAEFAQGIGPLKVGDSRLSAVWRGLAEKGLHGLCIPRDQGGRGLSTLDTAIAIEALGYGCADGGLAFAVVAQLMSCTVPIWHYGSELQQQQFLAGLCSGDLRATNAMTEASGGSAAFQMAAQALPVVDGYQLSGDKSYCANAPIAELCLAYVATNQAKGFAGGISALVLERDQHGFTTAQEIAKPGLQTCPTGTISLDGVRVSKGDFLGGIGGGGPVFARSMDWGRVGMAAMQVGTMRRLLEHTVAFAKARKPGGVALTSHQAVSHVLADCQVQLDAAQLLTYRAAIALERRSAASPLASAAKLFASEAFKSMAIKLMQVQAQNGYQQDSEISLALQDAVAGTLYSGTSEIQRDLIARWMGC